MRIRHFCFGIATIFAIAFLSIPLQADNIFVDDDFSDVNRTKTGALDADWWSSSSSGGNSVEIDANGLGLVTGNSGRGIHATFAPLLLGIGDNVTVTYTFNTPATVGSNSTAFKVALMDFNNPGLAADLTATSSNPQPLYFNLPGYMSDFDVNSGATADVSIREHNTNTTGRFLGTTGEWTSLGSSSDAGYAFTADTQYTGVFRVTRTGADSVDIFSSLSQGATLLDMNTESDTGIANNFGMFGLWANSNTFGSVNTSGVGVDNGITLTRFTVTSSVPEPGTAAFLLGGFVTLGLVRRRK